MPQLLSSIDATMNRIINVAEPTTATDAATKQYVDGKAGLDQATADARYVDVIGDTMTGDLSLTAAAGTKRSVVFRTAGSARWIFSRSSHAESGGNAGSNFIISRYDDASGYIDDPLRIDRVDGSITLKKTTVTGALTLNADPTAALHAATKQYVDGKAEVAVGLVEPTNPLVLIWIDTN
jgi:hypothetical protein